MKAILISIALILAGGLGSCKKEPSYTDQTFTVHTNDLALESSLMEIVMDSDKSFQKLHEFYQMLKNNHSDSANYEELRSKVITHMALGNDKLQDQPDLKIIEYYLGEILSLEYIHDTGLLSTLLLKLKGYWEDERIAKTADSAYSRNMSFIRENFPNPEKAIALQGKGLNQLKSIANSTMQ